MAISNSKYPPTENAKVVPLVYGLQTVEAQPIAINYSPDRPSAFWYAICYGPITLKAIITKSRVIKRDWLDYEGDPAFSNPPCPDMYVGFPASRLNQEQAPRYWGIANSYYEASDPIFTQDEITQEVMDHKAAPVLKFVVSKVFWDSPIQTWVEDGDGMNYGANPSAVIYDLFVNRLYGLRKKVPLNLTSFTDAASYFNDRLYGINVTYDKKTNFQKIVSEICSQVGCSLVTNFSGEIEIKPDYSVSVLTPSAILTEENYSNLRRQTQSWNDIPNRLKATCKQLHTVKYSDETGEFSLDLVNVPLEPVSAGLSLDSLAGQKISEAIQEQSINLNMFSEIPPASRRLHEILRETCLPKQIFTMDVPIKYLQIMQGSVIQFTNSFYSIDREFARITKKTVGNFRDNAIQWTLELINPAVFNEEYTICGYNNTQRAVLGKNIINVTFPAYSDISYYSYPPVYEFNPDGARVFWGKGQIISGEIPPYNADTGIGYVIYVTDFPPVKIIRVKIYKNPENIAAVMNSNSLELLNVDVFY